nr:branched-chain-amino-acid aminotransferase, cytosolic [Quercus suber]
MAPAAVLTPPASGSATPTTTSASTLTHAGIQHAASRPETRQQAALDASKMRVTLTTQPRTPPTPNGPEVRSQKVCTDHMVSARWTLEHGWETPEMRAYGPLEIMPSASVLHYATECFEGLKLYRGFDGALRLFRPGRNAQRMRRSAARIALPDFDAAALEAMIVALCARDGDKWLPRERRGSFLYVRPTLIATDHALGVQKPQEALLYVILACFPDMSKGWSVMPSAPPALSGAAKKGEKQSQGLKLLASDEDTIRAWPSGFGWAKLGANYGPTLVAQGEARARGFDQVLWLFGNEGFVTEAGASNFFVIMKDRQTGKPQLITASLEEMIILDGITRASILELVRERLAMKTDEGVGPLEVVERRFTMNEIIEAAEEGRLVEAFAAGTAFFVAPVGKIHFRGRDIEIPMDGDSGVYARLIKQWLVDIMYGNVAHEWGVVVESSA